MVRFRNRLRPLVSEILLAGFLFVVGCSPSSDDEPTTPTIEEPYRPQFHYTPPRNWMNDPNGLVYHEGAYHFFHQYNPEGSTWGHMNWYHATSPDLLHWDHQGVAIPEEGTEMAFSGSAVVDSANSSGSMHGRSAPSGPTNNPQPYGLQH